jgi:Bifunctional DNA primase/polymerase, N-terminal
MNGRSRPREGGSEKTIAAVNTILAPTAADIAVPQITDNTPEVDAALALAAAGIYVFPVDHPELSICTGVGKHHDPFDGPDHQRGKYSCVAFSEKATTKEQVIRAHWSQGPRNIGINCGKSGLVVVDEDKLGAFKRYADEHGVKIPRTLVVATAKGRHYYFLAREDHPLGNKEGAFQQLQHQHSRRQRLCRRSRLHSLNRRCVPHRSSRASCARS